MNQQTGIRCLQRVKPCTGPEAHSASAKMERLDICPVSTQRTSTVHRGSAGWGGQGGELPGPDVVLLAPLTRDLAFQPSVPAQATPLPWPSPSGGGSAPRMRTLLSRASSCHLRKWRLPHQATGLLSGNRESSGSLPR